jgi:hypothetical protein
LQDEVGYFAGAPGSSFDVLAEQGQPLLLLEQLLNNGDDRNIIAVYVQGRQCV